MIKKFENYISQFETTYIDVMLDDYNLTKEQFNQIVDKVADWYYDNYNITFIGAGSYGAAFRVNNDKDKVLKLTTDYHEASNISFLVKKSDTKGIVEYFDIHEVQVKIKNNLTQIIVYSIIMEKLYDISDIERKTFRLMLTKYFKDNESDIINLYGDISKSYITCTWKEFLKFNPNEVDKFIEERYEKSLYTGYGICQYHIEDVKELANIYYEDILCMIWSTMKYNLELHDVHMENVRKTEDGHMKIIDVGGNVHVNRTFKSKSAPIKIEIDSTEEIKESVDLDHILPQKFNNLYYTRKDFLEMLKQILAFYYDEFGIKFIGSGAEGDAFNVISKDQTKVLKITTNNKEALSVEKARKYHIPGLVDYYDVRKVIDKSDVYFDLYAILMESVEPLNDLEKTVWTFLRGYFFNFKEFEDTSYLTIPGAKANYKKFLLTNSIERLNDVYNKYKINRDNNKYGFGIKQIYYITDNIDHDLMATDEAYQIMLKFYKTFCELTRAAIKYKLRMNDFHTDNIGKDVDGNLKFFDVLCGKNTDLKLTPIEINLKD